MVILRKSIPRRAFLRGAGATLALPLLDAMTPALAAEIVRPIRMAFIEVPNGIMMDKWTPATEGANFALTPILEPLAEFRDRMLLLSGLDQNQSKALATEGGDHPRACTAWLTGAHAKMTSGADLRAGISVDQVAARNSANTPSSLRLRSVWSRRKWAAPRESPPTAAPITIRSRGAMRPRHCRWRTAHAPYSSVFWCAGSADAKVRLVYRSVLDAVAEDVRRYAESSAQRTVARSTSIWMRSAISSGASSWRRRRAVVTGRSRHPDQRPADLRLL